MADPRVCEKESSLMTETCWMDYNYRLGIHPMIF